MDIHKILLSKYVSKKTELISIAGIHATILAIIMACLCAYVLFAFGNVHTFQTRAINEAEKINEIKFTRYLTLGAKKGETSIWDKNKMVEILSDIMQGHYDSSLTTEIRANRALGIMNAVMNQYPFSNRFFKTKNGAFGSRGIPDPIVFGDFEDVRKWVKDVESITEPLTVYWGFYSENLVKLMKEYSKTEYCIRSQKAFAEWADPKKPMSVISTPVLIDPLSSCDDFFSKLKESRKIMNKTKYFIQQADSFREKAISVPFLSFAFVMTGVIFILGVIFPLTRSSMNSFYLIWIPFMFYGIVYFYLIVKMLKIII